MNHFERVGIIFQSSCDVMRRQLHQTPSAGSENEGPLPDSSQLCESVAEHAFIANSISGFWNNANNDEANWTEITSCFAGRYRKVKHRASIRKLWWCWGHDIPVLIKLSRDFPLRSPLLIHPTKNILILARYVFSNSRIRNFTKCLLVQRAANLIGVSHTCKYMYV